ncbi:homoserine dehydrogenase, partial [Candidatus Bathyarchaeota archaeon]|nr:homoserine dehydrogenase [Candidatus Bathyarchaeota archaeon]
MRIILVGFGTVGRSFARILERDKDRIIREYGFEPQITTIVDSEGYCHDEKGLDLSLALRVKEKNGTIAKFPRIGRARPNTSRLIENGEAEAVVETTPSNFRDGEPGLSNIRQALTSKKHVVTVNKGPLALAMPALTELAKHMDRQLRFSGTVGGGTPFLSFASKCLPGEKIQGVHGILNGTTNYILTRMQMSVDYQTALSEAQEKGYAETDPRNDVEGLDTAAKIVIIANWVLKRRISLHDVDVTGITKVTPQHIKKARDSGRTVKLVGRLSETQASVKPEELSS